MKKNEKRIKQIEIVYPFSGTVNDNQKQVVKLTYNIVDCVNDQTTFERRQPIKKTARKKWNGKKCVAMENVNGLNNAVLISEMEAKSNLWFPLICFKWVSFRRWALNVGRNYFSMFYIFVLHECWWNVRFWCRSNFTWYKFHIQHMSLKRYIPFDIWTGWIVFGFLCRHELQHCQFVIKKCCKLRCSNLHFSISQFIIGTFFVW